MVPLHTEVVHATFAGKSWVHSGEQVEKSMGLRVSLSIGKAEVVEGQVVVAVEGVDDVHQKDNDGNRGEGIEPLHTGSSSQNRQNSNDDNEDTVLVSGREVQDRSQEDHNNGNPDDQLLNEGEESVGSLVGEDKGKAKRSECGQKEGSGQDKDPERSDFVELLNCGAEVLRGLEISVVGSTPGGSLLTTSGACSRKAVAASGVAASFEFSSASYSIAADLVTGVDASAGALLQLVGQRQGVTRWVVGISAASSLSGGGGGSADAALLSGLAVGRVDVCSNATSEVSLVLTLAM